eukprot:m.463083 g.463083  ORF g.463083 m.463083 type:complete len:107 (+) comp22908_c0_seq1:152-472(+)
MAGTLTIPQSCSLPIFIEQHLAGEPRGSDAWHDTFEAKCRSEVVVFQVTVEDFFDVISPVAEWYQLFESCCVSEEQTAGHSVSDNSGLFHRTARGWVYKHDVRKRF